MDWGIVVSVMVAMALFTVTAGILILMVIGLFVWRMRKHAGSQGGGGFKFPGCPLTKSAQNTQ
jgi:hypothetical protein